MSNLPWNNLTEEDVTKVMVNAMKIKKKSDPEVFFPLTVSIRNDNIIMIFPEKVCNYNGYLNGETQFWVVVNGKLSYLVNKDGIFVSFNNGYVSSPEQLDPTIKNIWDSHWEHMHFRYKPILNSSIKFRIMR